MKQILVETIHPINCPHSKIDDFTKAFKPYVDNGTGIEVIADYSDPHNTVDFNNRYRNLYLGGSSESARYMGLFGTRYDVGSLWADSVNGIYNMNEATKIKADAMLAVDNGYSIAAKHTTDGANINVVVKGKAPSTKKCNLVILATDINNKFKQVLYTKKVTISPTSKTLKFAGTLQYDTPNIICLFQDINNYTPDGTPYGLYEYEVFCVTKSVVQ